VPTCRHGFEHILCSCCSVHADRFLSANKNIHYHMASKNLAVLRPPLVPSFYVSLEGISGHHGFLPDIPTFTHTDCIYHLYVVYFYWRSSM
jgi:hypothetical protein